jgi:hypothetical protein
LNDSSNNSSKRSQAGKESAADSAPLEKVRRLVAAPRAIVAIVIGLSCLILYSITLAPDVLAHDSGEWQAAAATLGISHSPGSPAYLLLGYLFTLVPIGTEAARVSFLSAVVGAIGVSALFIFMIMLLDR